MVGDSEVRSEEFGSIAAPMQQVEVSEGDLRLRCRFLQLEKKVSQLTVELTRTISRGV